VLCNYKVQLMRGSAEQHEIMDFNVAIQSTL